MRNENSKKKVLLASLVGSAIEWFDYFLYGTMVALVFGKLFFPNEDPVVGTLLAYLTFSLTFFIRPFGGIVFAHIGDRFGRRPALVLTLTLMGIGTSLIGVLPTYDQVGVLAPVLLILLRIVQGVGIGGEWGGALLLAYEHAPPERKGFFGSIPQMGVTLGLLMATFCVSLVSLLPEEAFLSWGWRLPFVLSAVTVAAGLWIRRGIEETPEFQEIEERNTPRPLPLAVTLREHWREVSFAAGAKFVETGSFYIFTVFAISYATLTLDYDRFSVLNVVTLGAVVASFAIPAAGWISDRIGRRRLYLVGCVLTTVFVAPYFLFLGTGSVWLLAVATVTALGLIWPMVTSVLGTLISDLFQTEVRYTGITLGYQIGAALVGGTAPLLATWLLAVDNGHWRFIAMFVALLAVISGLAVLGRSRGVTTQRAIIDSIPAHSNFENAVCSRLGSALTKK